MGLTVGELIEHLQDFYEDAQIRLASQPSYPFEYTLHYDAPVVGVEFELDPDEGEDGGDGFIVYIVEGTQTRYLPGDVRSEIGW